jgi:hypothetical protein
MKHIIKANLNIETGDYDLIIYDDELNRLIDGTVSYA